MSYWKLINARYGSGAGETDEVRMDASTNTLQTIEYPHHEIHSGSHYYVEGHTTLANEGTYFVKLVTPNTAKWSHFTWEISSTGLLTTTFDEGATGGMADGSAVTPINNNRNSSNTSGMTLTGNVTVAASYVTRISNQKFGVVSTPSKATGGGGQREHEIILKQNTTYLRSFISGSNDNVVNFKASWYEHTDKH